MAKIEIEFGGHAQSINDRRVINGVMDGMMQVAPLKHAWTEELVMEAIKNTWIPQEIPMAPDIQDWNNPDIMNENEKKVYKRALAFVSNLDGLQTNNLSEFITPHITSPEVQIALVRQTWEEALHTRSYSYMTESLQLDPDEIYNMFRRDKHLYEKNKYVLDGLNRIAADGFKTGTLQSDQDFLEACYNNVILEGVYFYSSFIVFYNFKRNGKMMGSSDNIAFINRDEEVLLNIIKSIREEQPELYTEEFEQKIIKNFVGAVEHEIAWGLSCIGDGILGLTPQSLTEYIQFVGNTRLRSLGLPKQWDVKNPFPWLDEYTQGNMTETNFFEGTVREYQTGSLDWD